MRIERTIKSQEPISFPMKLTNMAPWPGLAGLRNRSALDPPTVARGYSELQRTSPTRQRSEWQQKTGFVNLGNL